MNDRPTPETDDMWWKLRELPKHLKVDSTEASAFAALCGRMGRQRDEAREQNAAIRDALQTVRDEAFGSSPEESAMQNIAAIEKGIADMRKEYWELRDAWVCRLNRWCHECMRHINPNQGHAKTCRHAKTELEVLQ